MSVLRSDADRRATRRTLRWAAWYTRGLAPGVAGDRLDEIASDLHEHAVWAEEAGMSPEQLGRDIHRRRLHGMFDDLLWRREQKHAARDRDRVRERVAAVLGGALALTVLTVGGVAALSAVDYVRSVSDPLPLTLLALGGALALGLAGLVLLVARRTRSAGLVTLAVAGPAVLYFALGGLEFGSAVVTHAVAVTPGWRSAELGLSGSVGLLFAAAALWSWPARSGSAA